MRRGGKLVPDAIKISTEAARLLSSITRISNVLVLVSQEVGRHEGVDTAA